MARKLINNNWVELNERNVLVGNAVLKVYQPISNNIHFEQTVDMEDFTDVVQEDNSISRINLQKSLSFM